MDNIAEQLKDLSEKNPELAKTLSAYKDAMASATDPEEVLK